MTDQTLDKAFNAAEAEARIYADWENGGAFKAGVNAKPGKDTFSIVIPPPNVNGSLHIGHALNNTLQDILTRWKRMQGFDTLWQPGQDHAGIAMQIAVEKDLAAKGKPGAKEIGREAFLSEAWRYKEETAGGIIGQLKRLGASCDWSRNAFTMSGAPGAPAGNDGNLHDAVLKVFVDFYEQGLIYRGKRLVNWDPKFETAISDLEVENIEVDGHMWHFKYPLAGGATYEYVEKDEDGNVTLRETRDYISIATTRPETMLGDGAVAVHPSDERYAPIVGKLCEIPVGPKEHRRLIPIITDEYPDKDFGSGAVKITGAHDFNDYGVAKRGGIPCYRLMDTKAAMRADGAPYAEEAAKAQAIVEGKEFTEAEVDAINLIPDEYRGLDRFECRKKVVADISAEGLAVMVEAKTTAVPGMTRDLDTNAQSDAQNGEAPAQGRGDGEDEPTLVPYVESKKIMQPFGDRSKVVIEPMLTDQWFVDAETLAKPALEAVRSGETKFAPQNWEKTYFHWLEDIQPWCISRQLWWGHQIPVWYGPSKEYLVGQNEKTMGRTADNVSPAMFCAPSQKAAVAKAKEYYGENVTIDAAARNMEAYEWYRSNDDGTHHVYLNRDPDVLDTWFSSALWPYSTLGWPEKTPELEKYYKTDVLITGNDIIFFWVARMMMTGIHFMDEVPFHTVYINSIVTDAKGKKMSKSVGNVIDPLELIDQYGADAVRFTLTAQEVQARRMLRLAPTQVEGGRNFGTKLWNAARFAEMNECAVPAGYDPAALTQTVNKWIVGETARAKAALDDALDHYRFNDAAGALFTHVRRVFCDWYVEFAKPLLQGEDDEARAETQATMAWALDQCLILLHPIMPFITEDLWAKTADRDGWLMHTAWPDYGDVGDAAADAEMAWVIGLIEQVRSVRSELNVNAGAKTALVLIDMSGEALARFERNAVLIQRLARIEGVSMADQGADDLKGAVTLTLDGAVMALPLAEHVDVKAEQARLKKASDKLAKEAGGIEKKLTNEKFLAKAPDEVVEEQRERLVAAKGEQEKLAAAMQRLAEMG